MVCQCQGIWCPTSRQYAQYSDREAAHIVTWIISPVTMALIFGQEPREDDEKECFPVQNGLLFQPIFKALFDEGLITIVPCSDDPAKTELKVRVMTREEKWLNNNLLYLGEGKKNRDLHNRRLVFLNQIRPAKRYLYFMYFNALYKARNSHRSHALAEELTMSRNAWATPGHYIRGNMLKALAANLGHDVARVLRVEKHAASSGTVGEEELSKYQKALDGLEEGREYWAVRPESRSTSLQFAPCDYYLYNENFV